MSESLSDGPRRPSSRERRTERKALFRFLALVGLLLTAFAASLLFPASALANAFAQLALAIITPLAVALALRGWGGRSASRRRVFDSPATRE